MPTRSRRETGREPCVSALAAAAPSRRPPRVARSGRSSAASDDLSFLFAAQFSLSHVCWLLTYPIAGWVGASVGLGSAFVALSGLAVLGLIVAWRVWPRHDPEMLEHSHPELPEDHPHVIQHQTPDGKHAHPYMIDEYHLRWPQ